MSRTWFEQGDRVTFVGGTGRGDADTVTQGTVNGEPYELGAVDSRPLVYVPVYVHESDQCVDVLRDNILATEEHA